MSQKSSVLQPAKSVSQVLMRDSLEPASTAVPAAAAEQQNENYNDKKRVGIHARLPSLRMLGMLRITQPGTRLFDNV